MQASHLVRANANGGEVDNPFMELNPSTTALLFASMIATVLYIMRRRVRLGRRTPKF